jgi:hypothetical protein
MNSPLTAADQARLTEVARLVTEARANIEAAAALLRDGYCGPVGDENVSAANAYMAEWQRLTKWLDEAPVVVYHYVCQSEWTGGSLSDPGPGTQNITRWPSSFGAPVPEVK